MMSLLERFRHWRANHVSNDEWFLLYEWRRGESVISGAEPEAPLPGADVDDPTPSQRMYEVDGSDV